MTTATNPTEPLAKATAYNDYFTGAVNPRHRAWVVGEGRYSSTHEAWVEHAPCDGCGELGDCLHTDSSGREYGPVILCVRCITAMLASKAPHA